MIISHIPKPSSNIKKITIKNNIIEIMPVINESKRITKSVFYKLIFPNMQLNHKDLAEIFFFQKTYSNRILGDVLFRRPQYEKDEF
jgi:hypothetical protein